MRVKLKDIGKIVTGKTPSKREASYWDSDDIPFVKPDDFKNDVSILTNYNSYVSTSGSEKGNKVPANSVLVTCIGTIGKVVVTEKEVITNQQINAIIPNEKIDSKYLMYQILKKREYLNHIANAPVVPIVNKSTFEKVEIPLPPLTQQKTIAKTLDKAKELIELRKTSIEKLDELSKSVFIDMFGDSYQNPKKWEVKKLRDLTVLITDGVHHKPQYYESGIPFISVKDITTGILKFEKCKYIDIIQHEKFSKRCYVKKNDILYTKVGATYGRACISTTDIEYSLYVSVCLIKPNHEKINFIFLKELMNSQGVKVQADKSIKGIGVPDLHLIEIKKFNIILPPRDLQNKFAKTIQKIESQKALYAKELVKLEENFEALLAKSFG